MQELENKKLNVKLNLYKNALKREHEAIHKANKLEEVIEKAINDVNLVIELIKLQPTKNDNWILNRLNALKIILEDKEVK